MTQRALSPIIRILGAVLLSVIVHPAFGQAGYAPDCNNPAAKDRNCTEPTKALVYASLVKGNPNYIGHAEPTALFFSNAGASGNNMQWKFKLPATDPAPNQSGTSVANFELDSVHWIGLALCDPNSKPYGACTPLSDANNPFAAGTAFLELQFNPPGFSCSNSQWCVNLHINTWEDNNATQVNSCEEPTTSAWVSTDGSASATPNGKTLLMNNGDTILVTIQDTANGLKTTVNDLTTSTSGSMVASAANGFLHNANLTDCSTTPFSFHPMYATAAQGQGVSWANLFPNVSFDFEIGHWELCSDTACSSPPQEPNGPGGTLITDTGCSPPVRGVGGCTDSELDHDGTSYLPDWPDGTANHPAPLILIAPNNQGVGPLSAQTSASGIYNQGYKTIRFETTETTNGAFYPFYSQAGTGASCVFNFGNVIPGVTTNSFGQAAQFAGGGQGLGTTLQNPCFPAAAVAPTISKAFAPSSIPLNGVSTLTFTISNSSAVALTGVSFADALPAGVFALGTGPSTCGGVIALSPTSVSLSGGAIPAGGSCTFSVTVQATAAGSALNTSGNVTSDQSLNGNTASATLTVVAPPSISKTFGVASLVVNGTTSLSFTVTNPNAAVSLVGVAFTDTLPVAFVVATPNGLAGACGGGTITAVAGSGTISLAGATLAAGASCTFSVNVTAIDDGVQLNSVTASSTNGGSGTAGTAGITTFRVPTITKAFGAAQIFATQSTSLTLTLNSPNTHLILTGVAFSDTLPMGLVVSTPNGESTTCSGTVTAVAGSNSISLTGATLAPGQTCTVIVNVTGVVAGTWINTTSTLTSNEATPGTAATAKIVVFLTLDSPFQVSYAANPAAGESYINLINDGANGAQLLGPGIGPATGNICVNVYAFAPDEQEISCCSCLLTPNQVKNLGVNRDLTSKTLTGVVPTSVVVKLAATLAGGNGGGTSCTGVASIAGSAAAPLVNGMVAFGTTPQPVGTVYQSVEHTFLPSTLSPGELASITNRCANIIGNGSGFGICASCQAGAVGAGKQ